MSFLLQQYGKFTLPQIPDIKELKGDKLAFKIEFNDNQIAAKLISLNGTSVKATHMMPLNVLELTLPAGTKAKSDVPLGWYIYY